MAKTLGLKRTIRDLVVDLNSISESLQPAVGKVLKATAEQTLTRARRTTPVKTGFMRSRWRNDKRDELHWSVSNDTWYLPVVNQKSRHAGFANAVGDQAAVYLEKNLHRLDFDASFDTGTVELDYDAGLMGQLRSVQEPIRNLLLDELD